MSSANVANPMRTTQRSTYKQTDRVVTAASKTTTIFVRTNAIPTCHVSYDDIATGLASTYPLRTKTDGTYSFVNKVEDLYDVSYFNAELRRTITLGRYSDPKTAALAHSIVVHGDEPRLRSTPYLVQQTIQDMLTHSLLITDAFALPEALLGNAQNDEADLGGTFLIDDFQDLFTPE